MRLSLRSSYARCHKAIAVGALLNFVPSGAFAAGLALHTESTHFLGSSLAGAAAGGALSSMFYNPAAIGQFDGIWSESAFTCYSAARRDSCAAGLDFVLRI